MNKAEQDYYITLIRDSSFVLEPLPVILSDEWEALVPKKDAPVLKGIRAVLFDIYGTLFVSAAGEISAGKIMTDTTTPLGALAPWVDKLHDTDKAFQEMKDYFRQEVKSRHEKAKSRGIFWPEVRAEEIWAGYEGKIPAGWPLKGGGRARGMELALRFELESNPVYPMPHAEETLRSLIEGGYKLGIISNAQFYTPLLFNAFFNASPEEMGFTEELLIYSYKEKEAKPSPALFTKACESLAVQNILPRETLYIGNDMRNDMVPAAERGFVTALFAGDRRSLRLREDDPVCKGKTFTESRGSPRTFAEAESRGSPPNMVIKDLETFSRLLRKSSLV